MQFRSGPLGGGVAGIGPVSLRTLLDAEQFGIRAIYLPEGAEQREIRWVTVTEMVDPAPYLLGDELILTLGISWPEPTSPEITTFMERVASAGVSAVGTSVAPALQHTEIPVALVEAARRFNLPLIEIPLRTTFRSVAEYVVDRQVADRYAVARRTLEVHEALTDALLSRQGLDGLIARLRTMLDAPVALIDFHGNVLAATPTGEVWPTGEILAARSRLQFGSVVAGVTCYPVSVANHNVAFVCTRGGAETQDVVRFALGLVALEFSRLQAERNGRRELVGEVIEDLVHGDVSDTAGANRLARWGVDTQAGNRVVLARVACPPERLHDVPWNGDRFLPGGVGQYVVALVSDVIALVVSERVDVERLTCGMREHLGRLGPVSIGLGGVYPGVTGLRMSWYEAQEALSHGPGVNQPAPVSMSRLLLANLKVPLGSLGEEMLRPLLEYDREHESCLVETLRAFVEHDCQVSQASEAMYVHRNTFRYRMQLIEKLTDRDLTSFADLVNLYLAILALDIERNRHGSAVD
ncbi:purine catabolism regulator [Mycobacterium frederiksbergense]|uniref:Purine catabolism regulator n=1 Tax=Mycolicibacterium frederiksbergense TaxID=117567 RepID=A0ABT6L6L8_9MYCO|nr:PucR family transcriptional regulator [Mycolicibacterium frederiksbergense]MDH6198570.1 purine catabolism regulator [Mycolicibacterium frederiksbergense]